MFVSDCLSVNKEGHLTIGGCDAAELAREYGTPLYVYDEEQIRKNCRAYVKSIEDNYGGNGLAIFASKAFMCMEMCRICKEEKMGIDVASGGELYTAVKADFPMDRVVFHGNNKTKDELVLALESNVGRIVVDNIEELNMLNSLACEYKKTTKIMLRIKPGIDAHTHSFIRTGQIDSKFGFAIETGEAMAAVKLANNMTGVELCGVHCHIGSNIFDIDPFELAAKVMLGFINDAKKETGVQITELNLGGGFGIKYLSDDEPEEYGAYMNRVAKTVKDTCKGFGIPIPKIMIEPGRSVVGAEGITLYTVGSVKDIPGVRTYVSVDGGMVDNPRYALYGAAYEAMCANKADQPKSKTVTIAGKCCESGDLIQEHTDIQESESGDILAVLSTGAYNYSMASNYNRIPRPAAVMVKDSVPRVIIKRESYDDLIKNDV
ncbi:MAG: diaminopimelate decarboxylase [Oscillospiraceae bacterium]|jgi:diaminopimelate decarboxylase|nr:diaminopimelate decarboxylase [Oscillospiraceae bacterium]